MLLPPPANHLGTLSRVGYSFNAAVADILDNSIAANAKNVDIVFASIDGEPILYIADDGHGMSADELVANMVIGCKDPNEDRERGDLGRFGAGLKTASFSQAEVLTVCSWKNPNSVTAARWDTALIKAQNQWLLEVLEGNELENLIGFNEYGKTVSGTMVIWQELTSLDPDIRIEDLPQAIAKICEQLAGYLSLYFHRFLGRELSVKLNGRLLKPLDPFMRDINGYQEGPSHSLRAKASKISIQAHVLPRLDNLSNEQLDRYGGAKEIGQKQGLYIYRDKRLILAGGWYGLASHDELGKLTRIQVDVPATMDKDWQTDVKKSSLKIPPKVRQVLKNVIPSPKKKSIQVHKYKGRQEEHSDYWKVNVNELDDSEKVSYLINADNNALKVIYSELPNETRRKLAKYLVDLASEIPVNHIYATKAAKPNSIVIDNSEDELEKLLDQLS